MKTKSNLPAFLQFIFIILPFLAGMQICAAQKSVSIYTESNHPMVQFAADELNNVLEKAKHEVKSTGIEQADIFLMVSDDLEKSSAPGPSFLNTDFQLKPEGFYIRKSNTGKIVVIGADEAGVMYGGLELAEQISLYGMAGIQNTEQNPYMEVRGTKFNIPLDVRTPSYTDPCDVAQFNIPEVWSFDFWQQYIDNLAKNRYNLISLWNLHPFPSMVKVPDYPDVALNDVQRSTVQWDEYYDRNGWGFDAPEILAHPEIVKKISIDEKIAFWQKVMKYAKERNIRFYVITWNIFVNGTDGKYGITDKIDNQVTRDYFRKSVRQMFATYPDLAGIGLTTGENMPNRTSEEKEEWAYQTFGLGVLDAAKEDPYRKFTLVHRQHQSGAQAIARRFAPLIENKNIDFLFSFKYAQAHVMSSTRQTMHQKYVEDIKGMKTLWTLRNDDNYYFRWGAPDFVREFIRNIPMDVTKGFYYGSDQYVWGRDFLAAVPEVPRRLEVEKHWYHWMIWGRLGYNPELGNDRFVKLIENRFPDIQGKTLFDAWQEASMIYPKTTGFHWGALDFQWYIEACKSAPVYSGTESGFHDVNRFISLPPHPGTGYQSIPDYVKMVVAGEKSARITPLDVSRQIHEHSDKAVQLITSLRPGNNKELANTLEDIRSMALLGKYYAHKIHGATALALFRATGDKNHQAEAVSQLTQALDYWVKYYKNAMKQYKNPLWTNRVGHVDWVKLTDEVKKDIATARLDCTATLENGVLTLSNSKIARTYDWNGGHIITRSVTDKSSGKVWTANNKKPDLSLPGEAEKAENGSFSAKMEEESAIAPAHLEAEIICSLGKLSIRRVFRIYPDCPAIACDLYFRGESANNWIQPGTNLADMANIEKLTAANSSSKTPVMENLELPGRHWHLKAVEFFDITDRFNTLVREVGVLSYRPNLYRGNLLFAYDNADNHGIFILKEAPVSSVQLAYPGGDFIAEYGNLKAVGIGVNPADLDKDEWVRGYGFVTGVYSGDEKNALTALRSYQKMIRSLQPGRDEMILMNTWGDRGQDTRVRESFAFTELEAGAKLGITHFQLDDGWQTGRSSNSAFQGGSLESIWNNPKYWEPHPEKFPNGLAPVVKKGKELGIEVCLWFNPSKDNSNENWEKDADVLIGLYRKYGIRTFKIDGVNLPDKKAEINFRRFLDKVNRETDRQVVFNLDVTAGRRGGYHYFNEYGNLFLENRYTDWTNYYPYTTLRNLWMLTKYVPAEKLQIEFLNKWRNADKYGNDPFAPGNYSFDYLFAITMAAQPLAWFEGSGLPAEAVALAAPVIEKYRKIQHDLHQGTILPIGEEPSGRSWTGIQSLKDGKGYFIVFREGNDKPAYAMKTWLEPGTLIKCTLLAGNGKSFGATADANGSVTFSLEQKNSWALYQYEEE